MHPSNQVFPDEELEQAVRLIEEQHQSQRLRFAYRPHELEQEMAWPYMGILNIDTDAMNEAVRHVFDKINPDEPGPIGRKLKAKRKGRKAQIKQSQKRNKK